MKKTLISLAAGLSMLALPAFAAGVVDVSQARKDISADAAGKRQPLVMSDARDGPSADRGAQHCAEQQAEHDCAGTTGREPMERLPIDGNIDGKTDAGGLAEEHAERAAAHDGIGENLEGNQRLVRAQQP